MASDSAQTADRRAGKSQPWSPTEIGLGVLMALSVVHAGFIMLRIDDEIASASECRPPAAIVRAFPLTALAAIIAAWVAHRRRHSGASLARVVAVVLMALAMLKGYPGYVAFEVHSRFPSAREACRSK